MGTLLELLGSIGTLFLSFTKDVTEEEIEKNIKSLKEYQWFQSYLNDVTFENLIKEHKDVRYVIGKLNIEKMKNRAGYHKNIKRKFIKCYLKIQNNLTYEFISGVDLILNRGLFLCNSQYFYIALFPLNYCRGGFSFYFLLSILMFQYKTSNIVKNGD